ncbi:MAG: translation initiation factor IF-2 [Candidatus Paceibacterota bacterium]|jgi:translation initiation factor IF-2
MKTTRSPIVAVLGHIDHGKSTLLDYIRKSNVVDKEVGGITQNMSAYEVVQDGKTITFLDTPGHEAFKALRGRGAKVADIGILVVSAEDGVKPQTVEALKSILEAGIPYIVAMNKIDKEGANIERTKQSLLENEIYVEGYGGSIPCVPISAKTGKGVPELLDMISLIAEMEELNADSSNNASGIVIETNRDKNKGISATLMIKDGSMKTGMFVVTGTSIAPVRIFEDFQGKTIKEASFTSPVKVIGFDSLPVVGDSFVTFENKKDAEEQILKNKSLEKTTTKSTKLDTQTFFVPVIIKATSSGVIEAIEHELKKCETETVGVKIVATGVGDISENDIKLASGNPQTLVVGFNTKIDGSARDHAEKIGIEVKVFDIIYKLSEWVGEIVKTRTPKVEVEEERGRVKVLKIFSKTKDKQILG